jgi:hypothetical protein
MAQFSCPREVIDIVEQLEVPAHTMLAPVYALNAEISSMRLRALSQSFGLSMGYLAQFALTMAVPYIYRSCCPAPNHDQGFTLTHSLEAPGWLLAKTARYANILAITPQ